MPQTVNYSTPARHPMKDLRRELTWIQEPHFLGWGCSECAWAFKPSGSPFDGSIQEMKDNYLRLRDEEYSAHVCAEHTKAKKPTVQMIHSAPLRTSRIA